MNVWYILEKRNWTCIIDLILLQNNMMTFKIQYSVFTRNFWQKIVVLVGRQEYGIIISIGVKKIKGEEK